MTYFLCSETGKRHFIFGPGHTYEVANTASAPLLAMLPIDPNIANLCDQGKTEDMDFPEILGALEMFVHTMLLSTEKKVTNVK